MKLVDKHLRRFNYLPMVSKDSRSGSRILGARALFHRLCAKWTKQKKKLEKVSFWVAEMFYFYFYFFLQNTNLFICMVAKTRISKAEFIEIDTTYMYIVYYFDNHSRYI